MATDLADEVIGARYRMLLDGVGQVIEEIKTPVVAEAIENLLKYLITTNS
jgi:hypothetical protein